MTASTRFSALVAAIVVTDNAVTDSVVADEAAIEDAVEIEVNIVDEVEVEHVEARETVVDDAPMSPKTQSRTLGVPEQLRSLP